LDDLRIREAYQHQETRPILPEDVMQATTGEIAHRFIETNGIRMHIAEQGEGPLVLLCHGFPECWYAWHYQLPALAAAGYHVVAPDQRGYGQTDCPEAVEAYTILHLVGDLVGLLDALGEVQAVIVGHDWGANVAWNAALMRPDRLRAAISMGVPYIPRSQVYGPRASVRPTEAMRQLVGAHSFYQLYFLEPGAAEAEMESDVRKTMRQAFFALSGDATGSARWHPLSPDPGAGMFTSTAVPGNLPAWISEADIDYFAGEFGRTGFRGGLNWYRNFDRNWELTAAFSGAKVMQPALFIWGDRDPVFEIPGTSARVERQKQYVPDLREMRFEGCGHWIQMERASETNEAMITFLKGL
jgi:epoxide hydrolase A/B